MKKIKQFLSRVLAESSVSDLSEQPMPQRPIPPPSNTFIEEVEDRIRKREIEEKAIREDKLRSLEMEISREIPIKVSFLFDAYENEKTRESVHFSSTAPKIDKLGTTVTKEYTRRFLDKMEEFNLLVYSIDLYFYVEGYDEMVSWVNEMRSEYSVLKDVNIVFKKYKEHNHGFMAYFLPVVSFVVCIPPLSVLTDGRGLQIDFNEIRNM